MRIIREIRKNRRNRNGLKVGYWEEYYFTNGVLESKGSYVNGLRDGNWEYYNGDGKLHLKGSFKNDNRYGIWEKYYSNGDIIVIMEI